MAPTVSAGLLVVLFGIARAQEILPTGDSRDDLDEAAMLNLIPVHRQERCLAVANSPAIDYENDASAPIVASPDIWSWDVTDPWSLTETYSNTVFPNSAYASEDRTFETVDGSAGGDYMTARINVTVTYILGNQAQDTMDFCISNFQHEHLFRESQGLFLRLAGQYDGTSGTEAYARRILVLLDRFAHNYDSFELIYYTGSDQSYPWNADECFANLDYCSLNSAYAGSAHSMDTANSIKTILEYMPTGSAIDIAHSQSATDLSAELGYDVVDYIKQHILYRDGLMVTWIPAANLVSGNLLGWIPQLVNLAVSTESLSFIDYILEYAAAWGGNLDRDGVYLESYMYGGHAMQGTPRPKMLIYILYGQRRMDFGGAGRGGAEWCVVRLFTRRVSVCLQVSVSHS